jgi:molybdopterin-binding protein/molybdate transport repressor ModE-like protein
MTRRPTVVTGSDLALLDRLAELGNVVAAARASGMTRDRATYRLRRLADAFQGTVVAGRRGGRTFGRTRLTALGDRIRRTAVAGVEVLRARPLARPAAQNRLRGVYRAGPPPTVELGPRIALQVAFGAEEGEPVLLTIDPESVLIAARRFRSSARNVVAGRVLRTRGPRGALARTVEVAVGPARLSVAVTPEAIRSLALRAGSGVFLYVKATAIRRLAEGRGTGDARGPTPAPRRR